MIEALNIAASGIRFGQTQLAVAADNIANASTQGYERKDVQGTAGPGGGVLPAIVPGVDDGLAADIVHSIIAKHSVSANVAMFKKADAMTGDLIDLLG